MSWILVLLVAFGFWSVVLVLVAVGWRLWGRRATPEELELEELRARYARHEISSEDYERRRRELAPPR